MKETKGTYICQYFKMPHLYRDDLEKIEGIIRNQVKADEFHFSFDGMEYERLDQIPPDKDHTSVFVFYTHKPCMRLKFSKSWAELYCGETNETIAEGLKQITEIVSKSQRVGLWRFAKYSNWTASMVGFGAVGITAEAIGQGQVSNIAMAWALGVLALSGVWWFVGFGYSVLYFSRLDFKRRRPL